MLKKMNNMNIKGRLNYVFRLIIIAFSVVAVVISAMMIYKVEFFYKKRIAYVKSNYSGEN